MADDLAKLAETARAWPFEEARKVLARVKGAVPEKGYVLFETGYGPSGLPHIGTFGEVARTSWVRNAFAALTGGAIPTRLFAFSDDMDGLRKVPDNVPNGEMVRAHLGKPLTAIPDPFGTHESFGAHNNARLRGFLDAFGFEYEFQSSTECYRAGRFDAALLAVLAQYDAVMRVILPTLGPERRATYSPFLPISPTTGRVLQVPILARDADAGTVVFEDEDGTRIETPVTGGRCKLQWKADWAMRWYALGVDYEMAGKDLIDSVKLSGQICRILGAPPPEGFIYEMFLDEQGAKISKSKGNGLAVEDWLRYAPAESLALFMYNAPKKAKRLYFDAIPRAVDDYLAHLEILCRPGRGAARRKSGLAHPHRQSAGAGAPRLVRPAAQPRQRLQHRRSRSAVEIHLAICAGGEPRDRPFPRPAGRARGAVFPRLRAPVQGLPRADRAGGGGARRPRRHDRGHARRRHARSDPERGL